MYQKIFLILTASCLVGQVDFTVQTNASSYSVGELIEISGAIHNAGSESVTLAWTTGCQFCYFIGDWSSNQSDWYGCTLAQTWVELSPVAP